MFPGGGLVPGVPVVELRLLGPVQAVRASREVPLGGPRQRAVLALLVLEAGRVVPAGRLIDELWRGSPPPGAAVTLRSYVSRLRSALAPEVPVATRGGGYAIDTGPDQLDARRFERMVAGGHDALARGPAVASGAPPTRGCAPSYCGCSARCCATLATWTALMRSSSRTLNPTYWHVSVYLLTDSLVKMQV